MRLNLMQFLALSAAVDKMLPYRSYEMNDYEKFSNMIKELGIPAYFNNPNAELNEPKRVEIMNNAQGTKVQFNFTVSGRYESVTFV